MKTLEKKIVEEDNRPESFWY